MNVRHVIWASIVSTTISCQSVKKEYNSFDEYPVREDALTSYSMTTGINISSLLLIDVMVLPVLHRRLVGETSGHWVLHGVSLGKVLWLPLQTGFLP